MTDDQALQPGDEAWIWDRRIGHPMPVRILDGYEHNEKLCRISRVAGHEIVERRSLLSKHKHVVARNEARRLGRLIKARDAKIDEIRRERGNMHFARRKIEDDIASGAYDD